MCSLFCVLLLVFIEHYELTRSLLLVAITFTAISIAFSSCIIFSLMMDYSRPSQRAVDYAIQSSIFSFTRIISAIFAGLIVSNISYEAMFIFEFLAMLFVVYIIYRCYK